MEQTEKAAEKNTSVKKASADKKALKAYSAAVYGDLSEDELREKIDNDTQFYKGYSGIVKTKNALQTCQTKKL